ncbi:MAG TPA: serine hydrolase [Candidatus Saccharimonadales bacterium]|jgi:D-alanyl-D-alanine carboxypeptidase (penicillin-binding protein 5/6)
MKRKYIIAAAVVLLVLIGGGVWAYQRAVPAVEPVALVKSSSVTKLGQPDIMWSAYGGEQAIAMEGQNLSAIHGAQNPLPTASIAKVMTALAVLHEKPLKLGQQGPTMTMTAEDVSVYQQELAQNESVVKVSAGESLSEYQALEAMLVPSGTNVADTTAAWAFGSMSDYLAFANQYAVQLGLKNTHFGGDASGFSPETVSTPQDLIKLGEAAMQNPVIAQIVGQKSVTLPVAGTLQNFDIELGQSGIVGIKTGNNDQDPGAFLFAAKYHGLTIVGALMGQPNLGTALYNSPEVLSSFESSIETSQPIKAGQVIARYTLPWGGTVNAVAQNSLNILGWQGAKAAVNISLNSLKSPKSANAKVGTATITYNNKSQQTPIVLQQSAPSPSLFWRIFHL